MFSSFVWFAPTKANHWVAESTFNCCQVHWHRTKKKVFCYRNFSHILWERIVLVIEQKGLKFEAEGQEFAKCLRSLEQFIQTVKGQKSINLQYNILGRLENGTNEWLTKRLFQVLFFFHDFLQNSLQKSFNLFFFTKMKIKSFECLPYVY